MAPHSTVLAWKIHGRRSLVGRSPWGHRVRHDGTALLMLLSAQEPQMQMSSRSELTQADSVGRDTRQFFLRYPLWSWQCVSRVMWPVPCSSGRCRSFFQEIWDQGTERAAETTGSSGIIDSI